MRMIHYYSVKITIHKKLLKHSKPIAVYCQIIFLDHSLQLNAKKTELIVFFIKKHSRKKDEKYTITPDDKIIEEKTNVKYLGVVLDQFHTFQDEIKKYSQENGMRNKNTSINQKAIASENKTLDNACTGN